MRVLADPHRGPNSHGGQSLHFELVPGPDPNFIFLWIGAGYGLVCYSLELGSDRNRPSAPLAFPLVSNSMQEAPGFGQSHIARV